MSRETNVAAQEKFGEAINSGKFEAFDDVVAPDSVDHDPAPGQGAGPAGYRAVFTELRTAFPDFKVEVEHLTATDDDVALAYTATGTHDGELQGHPPTGKQVTFRGMQIGRFENGKLVERWGSSDQLGMLSQLGLAT